MANIPIDITGIFRQKPREYGVLTPDLSRLSAVALAATRPEGVALSIRIDPRIYRELRRDGRISFTELSRRTGIPRAVVSSQVRTALGSGDLRIAASVDPVMLGYSTMFHLSIKVSGSIEQVLQTLVETPSAMFVARCSGEYDIVAEVRGRSRSSLRRLISNLRSVPGVTEVSSLSYEEIVKSPRHVSRHRGKFSEIDLEDRALIFLLQQNGRMSFDALARQTRVSAGRARARVKRLIDSQIVTIRATQGRVPGSSELELGVGIRTSGDQHVPRIAQITGVEFLAATLGKYDLVATITRPDALKTADALEEIRGCDGVLSVESWVHLDIVRERDDITGTPS